MTDRLADGATGEALDGTAVAGHFAEVFGIDLTTVTVTCKGCNASAVFAEQRAYVGGPGAVLRCPGCDHMLARIVQTRTELWLDLSGSASWRFPIEPPEA